MFKPLYKSGEKPNKFQLMQKDIGVNLVDKILFFKDLNQQIVEIGSGTTQTITSEGIGTEYAIKQADGTLIIVIPSFTAVYVDEDSMALDVVFPVSFIDTNYSVAMNIVGRFTLFNSQSNSHKMITEVKNKAVDGATLGVWSDVSSAYVDTGDEVEMSATLTGRWK